jgi:hypothetical protein
MRALSASELLCIWEQGPAQSPVQWALTVLDAAHPDASLDELAKLPVGQRNGLLMKLRHWTFGPLFHSVATCANCHERLELAFSVSDLQVTPEKPPADELSFDADRLKVRFRLPDSLDLAAILVCPDVVTARQTLLQRCVLSIRHDSDEKAIDEVPEHIVAMIAECMEQADPQANIRLLLACPACRHESHVTFDIVTYFWHEINAWAQGVLRDVHLLASAYGWHESDILGMNPWRRQLYLEMING